MGIKQIIEKLEQGKIYMASETIILDWYESSEQWDKKNSKS